MKYKHQVIKELKLYEMDFFLDIKPINVGCNECGLCDWEKRIVVFKYDEYLIEQGCKHCCNYLYAQFFKASRYVINIEDV